MATHAEPKTLLNPIAAVRRVVKAALKIKETVEGWQPDLNVSAIRRGPFCIAYVSDGSILAPPRRGAIRLSTPDGRVTVRSKRVLLDVSWSNRGEFDIHQFTRGSWEKEFLRLA